FGHLAYSVRLHSKSWQGPEGDTAMFAGWGRFVHRRRWPVLAVSALLLLASGWTAASGAKLQSGGFIETSDSGRASRLIEHELPAKVRSDRVTIAATGVLAITNGFNDVLQDDLRRAETVSLPLALVLLLIVFGSVVAGFIPLGVGILAVMSGIAGMFVLARFT